MIELNELKDVLPPNVQKHITPAVVEKINAITGGSPEELEFFRDNLYGYGHVLKEGKFKFDQYVAAVRYCTYKLLGMTNQDAYARTFRDRYASMRANGYDAKKISTYVCGYSKTKLVNLILDQARIAPYLYNMDNYQKTINELMDIILDKDVHPRDRVAAGSTILQHLKPPEDKQVKIDITTSGDTSIMEGLRAATMELVNKQRHAIESGLITAKDAAESKLVMGEVIDG